jgi:hypothetical protein
MKVIRKEIDTFLERQDSIVPWRKKRSPSPVEEKSEHSSEEEDKPVDIMGAFDPSSVEGSREGSFERTNSPVKLVTAQTTDTVGGSATPAEAISKGKVELLK